MAYEYGSALKISLVAGADLSTFQYCFVGLNASGQAVALVNATDVPVGVLQNKPVSGSIAEITVIGVSKLVADVVIAPGNVIGVGVATTPKGRATTKAATNTQVGQALSAGGAAGTIFSALINCVAPAKN